MAILGWLTVVGLMGWVTLSWGILALMKLGRYNIGGVPNTWVERTLILVAGAVLAYVWYTYVYQTMPFAITMKAGS